MRQSGDSHEDMERFALDPDTANRLLSGALDPEDAPHRYGEVASLLRIAAGPTSGALDGEAAAVTAVVEAIRSSHSPAARAQPRRQGRRRHRRHARLKAATAHSAPSLAAASTSSNAAPRAMAPRLPELGAFPWPA